MMYEFEFESYMNIDVNYAAEVFGTRKECFRDQSMFKFVLADLLYAYDELACSIHNNSEVLESLLHLYARLNVFKHELISIGVRNTLIELVSHETANIFAQCVQFDSQYPVTFANMMLYRIV